jgi:hypothetical protein
MEASILFTVYVLVFVVAIRLMPFFKIEGVPGIYLALAYLIKLLAGLTMVWVYSHFYTDPNTADIFLYFRDTEVLYSSIHADWTDYVRIVSGIGPQSPDLSPYFTMCNLWWSPHDLFINNYRTVIRLNAFIHIFSFGHLIVHVAFMSFLSFIGLTAMLKVLLRYARKKALLLYMAVFLPPSLLFWSSGILKEAPIMFGLGLAMLAFQRIMDAKKPWANALLFALMMLLILLTKVYLFFVLIAPFITWAWGRGAKPRPAFKRFALVHLLLLALVLATAWLPRMYSVPAIAADKQAQYFELAEKQGDVGSLVHIPKLNGQPTNMLLNMPGAFLYTLLRPHPFEPSSLTGLVAALENLLILAALLLAIVHIRKPSRENMPLLLFALSFVFILFTLVGLVTPVLGAVVRYKAPALPFLFICLVLMSRSRKTEFKGMRIF